MRRVRWAPEALRDLKTAFAYVAPHNETAALTMIDRIREAGDKLGRHAIGRPGRTVGTYEFSVARTPYIIAYEILPDGVDGGEGVFVLRVIHASRLWEGGVWPPASQDQ